MYKKTAKRFLLDLADQWFQPKSVTPHQLAPARDQQSLCHCLFFSPTHSPCWDTLTLLLFFFIKVFFHPDVTYVVKWALKTQLFVFFVLFARNPSLGEEHYNQVACPMFLCLCCASWTCCFWNEKWYARYVISISILISCQ